MYTESEIKKILSRAAEIQNRSEEFSTIYGTGGELTADEIKEIAKEINVSVEYVRQAIAEFEGIPVDEPFFIDNADRKKVELLGFARGEPDSKTWAELRSVIEQEFRCKGKVIRNRDSIQWKSRPEGISKLFKKNTSVEVKKAGSQTSIRLKKNIKSTKWPIYGAYASLAGFMMLFTVMLYESTPEAVIFMGILLVLAKLFQKWHDNKVSKEKEHLKDTMADLQTIVSRRHLSEKQRSDPESNHLDNFDSTSETPDENNGVKQPGKMRN